MVKAEKSERHIACNRLIDEKGNLHGVSVITIDRHTHKLLNFKLLQNEEYPFTEWIGGTIVLLSGKNCALPQHQTLRLYMAHLSGLPRNYTDTGNEQPEAWHTSLTELDAPLPHPLVKL